MSFFLSFSESLRPRLHSRKTMMMTHKCPKDQREWTHRQRAVARPTFFFFNLLVLEFVPLLEFTGFSSWFESNEGSLSLLLHSLPFACLFLGVCKSWVTVLSEVYVRVCQSFRVSASLYVRAGDSVSVSWCVAETLPVCGCHFRDLQEVLKRKSISAVDPLLFCKSFFDYSSLQSAL